MTRLRPQRRPPGLSTVPGPGRAIRSLPQSPSQLEHFLSWPRLRCRPAGRVLGLSLIFHPKGVTRAFPSNVIAWRESRDRAQLSRSREEQRLFILFFLEGKALVTPFGWNVKAESEDSARGPAAKSRPAGEMLKL
jgi:hypothetical protein